jgi:hypothetical protein
MLRGKRRETAAVSQFADGTWALARFNARFALNREAA